MMVNPVDVLNRFRVIGSVFSTVALLAMPVPSAAETQTLTSTWQILAHSPNAVAQSARVGDELFQQALVPQEIATLVSDVDTVNGKVILKSGSQLMKMAAGEAIIFCDLASHKASPIEKMMIGNLGETVTCLIDRDRDGHFSSKFAKKVQYEGIPTIRGGYPAEPEPVMPTSYTTSNVPGAAADYVVGIKFMGRNFLDGVLEFQIVFGRSGKMSGLTDYARASSAQFPTTLSVLGSSVTLFSFSKVGGLQYRVDSAMPAQPFSVLRSFQLR